MPTTQRDRVRRYEAAMEAASAANPKDTEVRIF